MRVPESTLPLSFWSCPFPIIPSVAHAVDSWKSSYSSIARSQALSTVVGCCCRCICICSSICICICICSFGCVSVMQVPVLSLPLACVACVKMFAHQNPSIENSSRCCSCSHQLLLFRMRLVVGLGLQLLLENAHFYERLSICVIDKLS